jgi:ribonuclease J
MIGWVRPQILIPAHGEPLHMAEHGALARRCGVGQVLICRNGDMVRLAPGKAEIIDEVPSGRFYKDGALLVDAQTRTLADRRRLGFAGIVTVALALDQRGEMVGDPKVELTGIPETDRDGNIIAQVVYDALLDAYESMPRARRRDPEAVAESLRRASRAAVSAAWRKKPICHVQVLSV